MFLNSTTSSLILNNRISSNNQSGVLCQSSWETPISQNIISSNTITNNGEIGIHLLSSRSSTLTNNIVNNNNKEGISLTSSEGNTLTNNTITNNSWYGIAFSSSSYDNSVQNNNFSEIFLVEFLKLLTMVPTIRLNLISGMTGTTRTPMRMVL
ncbi:MAG: right-handed parallel beta-helix repeat-containing protein [Candidatus Thorarchaeota archaeon]